MDIKPLLETAALMLAVVNGAVLFSSWLGNRPKIKLSQVHDDGFFIWAMRLDDSESDGLVIRNWAILTYVGFANVGKVATDIDEFRLWVKTRGGLIHNLFFRTDGTLKERMRCEFELRPQNIPEPILTIEHLGFEKRLPLFGVKSESFDGETYLETGRSKLGMLCYVMRVHGGEAFDPRISRKGKLAARLRVREVFGRTTSLRIRPELLEMSAIDAHIPNVVEFLKGHLVAGDDITGDAGENENA